MVAVARDSLLPRLRLLQYVKAVDKESKRRVCLDEQTGYDGGVWAARPVQPRFPSESGRIPTANSQSSSPSS